MAGYTEGVKKTVYQITQQSFRDVRKLEAKLTQDKFASELGISIFTVKKMESGKKLPSLRLLFDIAERYGVTFEITPEKLHPLLKEKNGASE